MASKNSTATQGLAGWLHLMGPGLITAALVFGPSKMTITSKLGALYSTDLLWIVLVATLFMIVFTSMAARIGLASSHTFLQLLAMKWGRWAAVLVGAGVFLVCSSFQAGNAVGVGIAMGELFGTSPTPWILGFTALSIALLFFKSFYKVLEQLMILLILLMLASFVMTLLWTPPSLQLIAQGFQFKLPPGSQGLVIAFIASSFSLVGALYQAYLVQERRRVRPETAGQTNGTVAGIILLGLMSSITLLAAANILYPRQINPQSASDMGKALEPLFGAKASAIFLVGLFGAGFSSLVGNASVGGSLLSDGLGWGGQFKDIQTRWLIAAIMLIGATVAVLFGKLPLQLIIFAQSITIFIVPLIGIALFLIANDPFIMGDAKNKGWQNMLGIVGLLLIVTLAALNFNDWFLN
ncbi:Nramp family divalent metal transporter [Flavihumibacter sp. CACIAM 22H1]|uniref:Nramp family divalent metal transporter n=1 Tax=Flavihumibacter sp. CACIAM 22H1 TaxID=1812911 RepID=UPI0007A80FBE|nr:Nramp family divalent metal transporter [Flavihumibacter sp. CACIAM 22H1]KYP14394.1 MAG: manganese transporter [Flavihumibacter sp. CACIAM 22H1]